MKTSCLSATVRGIGIAIGLLVSVCAVPPADAAFVFDLADAIGGGDGSLPGTGGAGDLGAAAGTYTTFPSNAYVDGTFVPNSSAGAIPITSGSETYDFDAQTSAGYYSVWINGNNLDTNPCSPIYPDFRYDSNSHSLIAAHANKGITFDLAAIRSATSSAPNLFTVYAGDSRPKADGSISYWVFVDGVLAANRNSVSNSEDALFIELASTARYLTLAISDSNNGIGSDHGYFGDAFLRTAATWTGGGADGNWSTGDNWDGGATPTSSTSTDIWITGDTNVGALTQDVAAPFVLNRLQVTGAGMTNAVDTGGQALSFQADGVLRPSIHISRNTAVTLSGALELAADTEFIIDNGDAANDLTVSGTVTGSGEIIKYGLGTVLFNGANGGFAGRVQVNGGTIRLASNALINGNGRLHNNSGGGGTYDLNGINESVIALGGNLAVTNSSATPATFAITDGGSWDYSGHISGALSIVKQGSGVQQFSNSCTYTGATTIEAGTLILSGSGSIANSSRITVGDGAILNVTGMNNDFSVAGGQVLAGSGTVLGTAVIDTGGVLAPGASVGNLTASGTTWNPGGTFQLEVNDALGDAGGPDGWDLLTVTDGSGTGTLDLSALSAGNPFTIEIVSLSGTAAGEAANFVATEPCEWEFITYEQLSGAFSSDLFVLDTSAFANNPGAGYFDIVQTTSGLAVAFVPEPGAFILALTGLGVLLIRRKRR